MSLEVVGGFAIAALFVYALFRQVSENMTRQCPECDKRISTKAKVCPYCGTRFSVES